MNIFQNLGNKVKSTLTKFSGKNVQHAPIYQGIETAISGAEDVVSAFERDPDSSAFKHLRDQIMTGSDKRTPSGYLKNTYQKYTKTLRAAAAGTRISDEQAAFENLVTAMKIAIKDLKGLQRDENFKKIFGDLTDATSFRVSHAYALGYVSMVMKVTSFFTSMIYLAPHSSTTSGERVPNYITRDIDNSAEDVARFCGTLLRTRAHNTTSQISTKLVEEAANLSSPESGTNVFLMTGDRTLADYAEPGDYVPIVSNVVAKGFSPVMWVHNSVLATQAFLHTRRQYKREWMEAKISVLRMDLQGVDSASPEYQEKLKVVENYTAMLADLQKKIDKYEQG